MILALSLYIVLATGTTASAPTPTIAAGDAQVSAKTIQTDRDGTVRIEHRSAAAKSSMMRVVDADGRVVEATSLPSKRVLIELAVRPLLDRSRPGSIAEGTRQRQQLVRDLNAMDVSLHSSIPTKITREYHALFAGFAAIVDAASIADIRRLPNVAAVHEDVEVHAALNESVPMIGAPIVWHLYGVSGAGVKVAVLDTGIDYTHPDLGGCFGDGCKIAQGYDYVNGDADPSDDNGHGTHVAGIIAADGAVKGVAPGATLLAYKVLDANGYGYTSDIIAALEQAVIDGAQVANLSLGGSGYVGDPGSQAIDNATAAGMLSVVAAGNSGPSYRTIQSPGLARTALTVGAVAKSGVMASFSSRGYVADGEQFFMKPEVVAPGVDILSTVPASGPLGNASRYASLSGTSMATPHVAGAAALLLQWNRAQSPEEVRNRLVVSAHSTSPDLFTEGAGLIDLVKAFGAHVLASTTHVAFGAVEATSGTIEREQTIALRNTTDAAETFSLAAGAALPAGTTLEILPASVTLQPSESAEVTLRLRINAAVVPEPAEPRSLDSSIAITGATQTVNLPFYFFKGSVVALSLDEMPWFVRLVDASGTLQYFSARGTSMATVVKSGLWDVWVHYVSPAAIVAREQQNVQGRLSLTIDRSQAIHTVAVRAIDDAGQPFSDELVSTNLMLAMPAPQLPTWVASQSGPDEIRISDVSSRYLVGLIGGGPDPASPRSFSSSWAGRGVSSDILLPTAAPFRRIAEAALKPPGATFTYLPVMLGFALKTQFGATGLLHSSARPGEPTTTLYMQTNVPSDSALVPIHQTNLDVYDATFSRIQSLAGAYMRHRGGTTIEVDPLPWFGLVDPADQPDAILDPSVQRWDVDTIPNSLALAFRNGPSLISADTYSNTPRWASQTLSGIAIASSATPTFDLLRNGTVVGTYPLSTLRNGIASTTGIQQLRSTLGSATAVMTFDTTRSDGNPPLLSQFRIEQNGLRTATPVRPSSYTPTVRFRVTDNSAVTVTLAWRSSGTANWTPLPLTKTQSDYVAILDQGGSIDLQLIASDSAGNSIQESWTPAITTVAPVPPTMPASITATRSGPASIALSWSPSSSQMAIAGYRIERLPGNTTFTTTGDATAFIDTTGLVDGNAYFYRVSAIDINNAVSPFTPYEVATLIALSDDPLVADTTPIRGAHIAELRRAVDAVRQAAGLGASWTNYDPPTGFIQATQFTTLRDRLNEARTVVQLPAIQWIETVTAGMRVRASSLRALRDSLK